GKTQAENRERITITGNGLRKEQRVQWAGGSENEGEGLFIVIVMNEVNSVVQIRNIEMINWKGGFIKSDGNTSIILNECIFSGGGTVVCNSPKKLDISYSEFIGNGDNNYIEPFICITHGFIEAFNSKFTQGSFNGQGKGCIVISGENTRSVIESCEFIENIFGLNSAGICISSQISLITIRSTAAQRSKFTGLGIVDALKGYFIRSFAVKTHISFTDFCIASFKDSGGALLISDDNQQTNSSNEQEVVISDCIFKYLRGQGHSGAIMINISTKFGFNFSQNLFNENIGADASDIWINTSNVTSFTHQTFNGSFSESLMPNIFLIRGIQPETYNLSYFNGSQFVSMNGTQKEDGSYNNPYRNITYAINQIDNDKTDPLYYPRTINILDKWT
ncbi:MAG: hypothetical protein EZS28_043265, partial [Streblomastix strix]